MVSDISKNRIEYCNENNSGFCPFIHKKCDGLCNNCGLFAVYEPCTKIVKSNQKYFDSDYIDYIESCLIGDTED